MADGRGRPARACSAALADRATRAARFPARRSRRAGRAIRAGRQLPSDRPRQASSLSSCQTCRAGTGSGSSRWLSWMLAPGTRQRAAGRSGSSAGGPSIPSYRAPSDSGPSDAPFEGANADRTDRAPRPVQIALSTELVQDDAAEFGPHPLGRPVGEAAMHRLSGCAEDRRQLPPGAARGRHKIAARTARSSVRSSARRRTELLTALVPWFGWPMGGPDGEEHDATCVQVRGKPGRWPTRTPRRCRPGQRRSRHHPHDRQLRQGEHGPTGLRHPTAGGLVSACPATGRGRGPLPSLHGGKRPRLTADG